jgi:hypothetical protein
MEELEHFTFEIHKKKKQIEKSWSLNYNNIP